MFIIVALLQSLIFLINTIAGVLNVLIIARVLISWLGIEHYYNPIIEAIYTATEKLFSPFRRFNLTMGMFDFTPFVVMILIEFARNFLINVLIQIISRIM